MEVIIGIVAAIALGVVGFLIGLARGRSAGLQAGHREADDRLRSLAEAVRGGRTPEGLLPGSAEADLKSALELGWAPRDAERALALQEAIGRVSAFLEKSVRGPLTGFGDNASAGELRERIGRALGALEDVDFFVREPGEAPEAVDLSSLVQRVSKEFVADQGMGVRLLLGDSHVHASVSAAALMDALYLVLHNAGRFGGGQTVDLAVSEEGGRAQIVVRDHGPGFSEEAFRRAFDPFYSTSAEGLGLGLPHARKVVEGMGGRIELRNVPDGGAEVEMSFPAA